MGILNKNFGYYKFTYIGFSGLISGAKFKEIPCKNAQLYHSLLHALLVVHMIFLFIGLLLVKMSETSIGRVLAH